MSGAFFLFLFLAFALLFLGLGLALAPYTRRRIRRIINRELEARHWELLEMKKPAFPDTGPFPSSYRLTQTNIMARAMGLYPDYTAFRKLKVKTHQDEEKTIWIKIEFDILEFKKFQVREDSP
ncbi:MAG: hypothetical protein J5I94_13280 [Phaeodactylibacter sp.]|nr:hypothetical protein [Phaeodactylibacter sp.]